MNTPKIYGLYINLDERGSFFADVRDLEDNTIFEMNEEVAQDLCDGGFLDDPRNPDHVESHLRESGVIPEKGLVYDSRTFESFQRRYQKQANEMSP